MSDDPDDDDDLDELDDLEVGDEHDRDSSPESHRAGEPRVVYIATVQATPFYSVRAIHRAVAETRAGGRLAGKTVYARMRNAQGKWELHPIGRVRIDSESGGLWVRVAGTDREVLCGWNIVIVDNDSVLR